MRSSMVPAGGERREAPSSLDADAAQDLFESGHELANLDTGAPLAQVRDLEPNRLLTIRARHVGKDILAPDLKPAAGDAGDPLPAGGT